MFSIRSTQKRSRIFSRSKTARARARASVVSPNALLALLNGADVIVVRLITGAATVAALSDDLVVRKEDSIKLASEGVPPARASLLRTAKRAMHCSRRRHDAAKKRADSTTEMLSVSLKQLRVWGSTSKLRQCFVECVAAGCALSFIRPSVRVRTVCPSAAGLVVAMRSVAKVVTGDGLQLTRATGPGLKCFVPHVMNEFRVVFGQTGNPSLAWLTPSDVSVRVRTKTSDANASAKRLSTVAVRVEAVGRPALRIDYWGVKEEVVEVCLKVSVCGVVVADGAVEYGLRLRVLRQPQVGHQCAAVGQYVRTLAVAWGGKAGLAVSADENWMVLGLYEECTLFVYSLPGGELVRSFGSEGRHRLQFLNMGGMCFAPNGNILVTDLSHRGVQEITLEGVFVRYIRGAGSRPEGYPSCIAVRGSAIAVGYGKGCGPRVSLIDFNTGVSTWIGESGMERGQLVECSGIHFARDDEHVVVAEVEGARLSLFKTTGVFVMTVGYGSMSKGYKDVVMSKSGEYVVADTYVNRVCVFSPFDDEDMDMDHWWGAQGDRDGKFQRPVALATAGVHLYVLDAEGGRVQVFQ